MKSYAEFIDRIETAMLPLRRQRPSSAPSSHIPPRRRRHRKPGLGRDAPGACTCAGPSARASPDRGDRTAWRVRARASNPVHLRGQRRQRLRPAAIGDRRAPAGAHLALRRQRAAAHLVRSVFVYSRKVDDEIKIDIKLDDLRIDNLPLLRRRRPARQYDGFRGAHHAFPHRHRGAVPETSARSTRTAISP